MDMDDIELQLLIGSPIVIEGVGNLHTPLVSEVIGLGQQTYNEYLSYLLIDKSKVDIHEDNKEEASTFYVIMSLCFHDESFCTKFLKSLQFIFHEEVSLGHNEQDLFFYLGKLEEKRQITKDNIEIIQAIVRVSNQVKVDTENEDEYKPANEQARKIIEEMMARRKNKPKPKPLMNLHSIISGLSWKSSNLNILNVKDLTIYQLYDGFHRLDSIDSYHYTLVGTYTGNVDSKKINYSKIHWAKINKQNEE